MITHLLAVVGGNIMAIVIWCLSIRIKTYLSDEERLLRYIRTRAPLPLPESHIQWHFDKMNTSKVLENLVVKGRLMKRELDPTLASSHQRDFHSPSAGSVSQYWFWFQPKD